MSGELSERQRWLAFFVAAPVAGIVLLDIGKVNLALPGIEAALGAGPTSLQLISASYVVAFGLVLIPFGRLGDRGHRRKLVLLGLALYVLASVVSAVAWAPWVIVSGRILLGVAAGIMMPQSIGLIQQLFTGAERGKAFGAYGITTACSTATGPSLGGLLITLGGAAQGWRWIFLMNIPIGLVLLAIAWFNLPRRQPSPSRMRGFDPVGTVILGFAITFLLYPIVFTTGQPGDDPRRWWSLAVAAVFAVAFWSWERRYQARGGAPLIDAQLMRTPSYRSALIVAATWLACGPGIQLSLILYLQIGLGFSPFEAAVVSLPSAAGSAIGSWWAARRILVWGRRITATGLLVSLLSFGVTLYSAVALPGALVPIAIALSTFVQGLGGGLVLSPNHVLLLQDVPQEKGSLAASIGHLAQRIGNSLGVAVAAAAFYSIVYAQAGGLTGAPLSIYKRAIVTAYAASSVFLLAALLVVAQDHRRRRHEASSVGATVQQPPPEPAPVPASVGGGAAGSEGSATPAVTAQLLSITPPAGGTGGSNGTPSTPARAPLEIGVFSTGNLLSRTDTPPAARLRGLVTVAQRAQEAGFDLFCVGEAHKPPAVVSSPLVLLAHIAASTSTIRLSTSVSLITVNDPVKLAEDIATVQHLVGDRFGVMLGRGVDTGIYPWYGLDPDDTVAIAEERYDLLRLIWREQEVDWSGRFRAPLTGFTLIPPPATEELPRIWHTSIRTRELVEQTARYGEGFFANYVFFSAEQAAPHVHYFRERYAEYGHGSAQDAPVGAGAKAHVGLSSQQARREFEAQNRFDNLAKFGWADLDEALAKSALTAGSPAQVLDKIAHFQEQYGGYKRQLFSIDQANASIDKMLEQVDLLGEHVVPELRREYALV